MLLGELSPRVIHHFSRKFNDFTHWKRGLRTVPTGQKFVESFEALHALRRGTVKLRRLVTRYRPTQASVHETARAIVVAMDVLGS